MPTFELRVNGERRSVNAPEDMPLLWVLRDTLSLVGTKYGCGRGLCGACTVHVNGNAVRSCQVPIASASGGEVTTVEGLSSDGSHPLQRAWVAEDVPQCGYCQAGQIMTAAALLAHRPHPSRQEIVDAMDGNLCRCGTYNRILRAVERAASAPESHRQNAGAAATAPVGAR